MIRLAAMISMLLAAGHASAHSLNIFVRDEGGTAKGNAYFTGGDPAKNVAIVVSDESGSEFGRTTTDENGDFEYTGPWPAGTAVIVASTPDGHRAQAQLLDTSPQPRTSPRTASTHVSSVKSYEAELTDIHAAIDRLENRLWLRDVIGGIGYIFGLAGIWALWKSRANGGGSS